MKIVIAILLGALLAWFAPRWAASVPPLPHVEAQAAPPELTAVCEDWADTGQWVIDRCEDEQTGEVCYHSNSGMMDCRLD